MSQEPRMHVATQEELVARREDMEDVIAREEQAAVQRALAAVQRSKQIGLTGRPSPLSPDASGDMRDLSASVALLAERLDGLAARVRLLEEQERHDESA